MSPSHEDLNYGAIIVRKWIAIVVDLLRDDECCALFLIGEHSDNIHRCIVAYISDSFLLSSSLLPVPFHKFYPSMMLSLDHSVWFHEHFRTDDWMLYECESSRLSELLYTTTTAYYQTRACSKNHRHLLYPN